MSAKSPILDDLAGLMTGAMGAARAAGEEVKTAGAQGDCGTSARTCRGIGEAS